MREFAYESITTLAQAMRDGEISSTELVKGFIERIRATDSRLRSFITVAEEHALEQAAKADAAIRDGSATHVLTGVPIAVKDNIAVSGMRFTSNSRTMETYVAETDAPPVRNLRKAGAIILGKTNLNEFGWALPTEDDLKPTPYNPWNPRYASIGSSSGSGAAVAAGLCAAALGTDGGGSARLPAGQHNLIGIKPTHGRVSRHGMDTISISEISPLARNVRDVAILLGEMVSFEPDDPQSSAVPVPDYAANLDAPMAGKRIGVPRRYVDSAPLEDSVKRAFADALQALAGMGVEIVYVPLRGLSEARVANFVVLNAETYIEHAASLRATPELYGRSAYFYHLQGAFVSAYDYLSAKRLGLQIRGIVSRTLREHRLDALATPISPVATAEVARKPETHRKGGNAVFTAPFNLTGHPALSMPAGRDAETGLPIGIQLIGALYDELSLLQIAAAYEKNTEWSQLHPDFEALTV